MKFFQLRIVLVAPLLVTGIGLSASENTNVGSVNGDLGVSVSQTAPITVPSEVFVDERVEATDIPPGFNLAQRKETLLALSELNYFGSDMPAEGPRSEKSVDSRSVLVPKPESDRLDLAQKILLTPSNYDDGLLNLALTERYLSAYQLDNIIQLLAHGKSQQSAKALVNIAKYETEIAERLLAQKEGLPLAEFRRSYNIPEEMSDNDAIAKLDQAIAAGLITIDTYEADERALQLNGIVGSIRTSIIRSARQSKDAALVPILVEYTLEKGQNTYIADKAVAAINEISDYSSRQ